MNDDLSNRIKNVLSRNFSQSKADIIDFALGEIMDCIIHALPISKLNWCDPRDALNANRDGLFLAYQLGHPLRVAIWRCGSGYLDILTNMHINPEKVAIINLPEGDSR